MTKHQLQKALFSQGYGAEMTIKGVTGLLQSIQREDGSGSSFNVTLSVTVRSGYFQGIPVTKYVDQTVYVRTID